MCNLASDALAGSRGQRSGRAIIECFCGCIVLLAFVSPPTFALPLIDIRQLAMNLAFIVLLPFPIDASCLLFLANLLRQRLQSFRRFSLLGNMHHFSGLRH